MFSVRQRLPFESTFGNAASRSPAGARPIVGTHATPRKSAKTRLSSRGNIKLAPPICANGTNAKASDDRFVAALNALAYAAPTFAESKPLPPWRSTTWCPSWPRQPNGSHKKPHGHYGKDSKGRSHAGHPQSEIFVLLRNTVDASSHKRKAKQMYEPRPRISLKVASSKANGTYSAKFA